MSKSVIFVLVLVAFVGVQFARSLSCYSCDNPTACRNPVPQICSNRTANSTSQVLAIYHSNVIQVEGSRSFECANITYKYRNNNNNPIAVLGCVHPAIETCSLTLRREYDSSNDRRCNTCNWDLCRSPAGTFSGSFYTILASAVALLLAKFVG